MVIGVASNLSRATISFIRECFALEENAFALMTDMQYKKDKN